MIYIAEKIIYEADQENLTPLKKLDNAQQKKLLNNDYITLLNTVSIVTESILNKIEKLGLHNEQLIGQADVVGSFTPKELLSKDNKLFVLSQSESTMSRETAIETRDIKKRYTEIYSNWNVPFFIKRVKTALGLIENYLNVSIDPTKFFYNNPQVIDSDIMTFDSLGSLVRESNFVEYDQKGESSFSIQLNSDKNLIPNVNFGIEIIDIQNVDLNSNSFGADFFYWLTTDSSFTKVDNI